MLWQLSFSANAKGMSRLMAKGKRLKASKTVMRVNKDNDLFIFPPSRKFLIWFCYDLDRSSGSRLPTHPPSHHKIFMGLAYDSGFFGLSFPSRLRGSGRISLLFPDIQPFATVSFGLLTSLPILKLI